MIVFAAIVPHPPFSIVGIGKKEERAKIKKTIDALAELRFGLEKSEPDTVLIISPHSEMEDYHFDINSSPILQGSLKSFGLDRKLEFDNDLEISSQISYCCRMIDNFVHMRESSLDYGVLIPLAHLLKSIKPSVVHLSFSLMSYEKHYEYGEIISNVLKKSPKRIAVISSGELSHKLTPNAPAGYAPDAKLFDYWVLQHLANKDVKALLGMDKEFIEESAECGLRSFLIMLGIIYQKKYAFNLISYEYPMGVGYLVARFI